MAGAASLYRRHRPRTFDDVIGQEHVVRTLRNAVDQGNVHHAYLFVGSRGTGKTSMAKILASALNCTDGPKSDFDADDPAVVAIANGSSMDVVEMDAASHNGVDDIRELIESVALVPTGGSWKVYILDEAHMITNQGWNAFLKTLEEPPPNTVFVLATTEAAKILPTVADRCHRFDFRRPSVEQLSEALRRTSQAEAIEIGEDAVAMMARAATGSFRDALGTLEQLVTYGGKSVSSEDVQSVLGVADFDLLVKTTDAIADGDRRAVLQAIAELADGGRDMIAFARDLAVHIRNLLVTSTLGEAPSALGLTAEQSERLVEQSGKLGPERSSHTLDLLSRMITVSRAGGDPRLQLELALFKAARPEDDSEPDALLARIESLEQRSGQGAPASAPQPSAVAQEVTAIAAEADSVSVVAVVEAESEPEPAVEPEPEPEPEPSTNEVHPPDAPGDLDPQEVSAAAAPTIESVQSAWPEVIASINESSARLGGALAPSRPLRIDGRLLIIGFPGSESFARKTADHSDSKQTISEHLLTATGFSFAPVIELADDSEFAAVAASDGIDSDELIERIKKEFDATEMPEH